MEASSVQASVRRRRVHYFSGFDPRGAGYYHQLLREEGARPQPSGARVDTGPRVRLGAQLHAWPVRWSAPGSEQAVETEHLFMGWNDVIRAHWLRGPLALIGGFVRTYCAGAARLGLGKARAFYPPALLTTLLPLLFFGGTALLGLVVALLAAWALPHGFGWVAAVAGFALATGLWAAGARANLFWLVRIFNFIRVLGEAPLPPLTARSAEWLETIVLRQQQDPVDEVLLVGHSVGAIVMVETADALMRDARWQAAQPGGATGVVMLGQCIPPVAMQPGAAPLREALARLSDNPAACWLDVTALIDPMCFYRVHPLASTGLEAGRERSPAMLNAKFFQMYGPARWAALRRDKLRAHFLYLMTPERAGNWSFYDMLYGPAPLSAQVSALRAAKGAPNA